MEREDLLDKYLRNELSDQEQKAFAELEDKEADLAFLQDLQTVLQLKDRELLKEQFQSFEANQTDVPQTATIRRLNPWRRIIALAASIAILVAIGLWLLRPTQANYFAANFEPYPNIVAPIEKGVSPTESLAQAMQTYERGQYAAALALFEALPASDTTQFFSAISALANEEDAKALELLRGLSQTNGRFQQEANWYLALAYLKQSNVEAAKTILSAIQVATNHPYQRDAVDLLAEL